MTQRVCVYTLQVDSDQWRRGSDGQVTLRTWEMESPHCYENNQHTIQVRTRTSASNTTPVGTRVSVITCICVPVCTLASVCTRPYTCAYASV